MQMPANQGITNRAASDKSVPKDLIELLRLAKLQREQQAAARAQALNAPQTPTVKEQLEEATGIARMAQGGMVQGYADGGRITSMEDIGRLRNFRNERMNMDRSPEIEPELVEGLRNFRNERMNMEQYNNMPEDEFGEFSPEIARVLRKLRNERMNMDRSPRMAQGGMVQGYADGGFVDKIKALLGMRDDSGVDTLDYIKDTIKGYEGFDSKQRLDNSPIDMIAGYGSNTFNDPKYEGKEITKNMAEEDLDSRLTNEFIPSIERVMGKNKTIDDLNPMLAASLTSLAYNYGPNWANKLPTLAKLVASGDEEAIANEIERRGVDNKGINSNRRLSEADLIRRGTVGFNADIQNKPAMAQGGIVQGYDEGGFVNKIAGFDPETPSGRRNIAKREEKNEADKTRDDKIATWFKSKGLADPSKKMSDEQFDIETDIKAAYDDDIIDYNILNDYQSGELSADDVMAKINEITKPSEVKPKGAEEGGSDDATVEEGGSDDAVKKMLGEAVEGKKNLTDEVSPADMDSLIQSILSPAPMGDYAEDNKFEPESQSKLQTLADFLIGGAGTSNIGTTLANAAENMSAEADKDEAKQIAADTAAYTKSKEGRADTFARKSLVIDSNLKQAKIDADEAVKIATVNATYMPIAVAAVTKIETALNEVFNLAITQNPTMADLRAKVRSGKKSSNDADYQKLASEFMDNFNTTYATSLESLKRSAEKIGLPVSEIGLQGINSGGGTPNISPPTPPDVEAATNKYKTI